MMIDPKLRKSLRAVMEVLYPSHPSAVRFLTELGMSPAVLPTGGSIRDLWFSAIDEAIKQGQLHELLNGALEEYHDNHELQELSRSVAGTVPAPAPRSEEQLETLRAVTRRLEARLDEQGALIRSLAEKVESLGDMAREVIQRALEHYERGRASMNDGAYVQAVESLAEASRLMEIGRDKLLLGKVLALKSGIEAIVGRLREAIVDGRLAVQHLTKGDRSDLALAQGNLALALFKHQEYDEARKIFEDVLAFYEAQNDLEHIVQTLTHLTEMHTNALRLEDARTFAKRLEGATRQFESLVGPTTFSAAAYGATVGLTMMLATRGDRVDRELLRECIGLFLKIEEAGRRENVPHLFLPAEAGRAQCLWWLDRLDDAAEVYQKTVQEAPPDFAKNATDCVFNLGMIRAEQGRDTEAFALFEDARRRYIQLGDDASVQDANKQINRLKRRST